MSKGDVVSHVSTITGGAPGVIHTYGEWCYMAPALDGEALVDGDRLAIVWPDGTHGEEVVRVREQPITYMDQGRECYTTQSIPYISTAVHGIAVNVPIVGLRASRIATSKGNYL